MHENLYQKILCLNRSVELLRQNKGTTSSASSKRVFNDEETGLSEFPSGGCSRDDQKPRADEARGQTGNFKQTLGYFVSPFSM